MRAIALPLYMIVLGSVGPGRLRWTGIAVPPRRARGRDRIRRGMGPIRIRWGLTLVLALGLLILWGELSPAASASWALR
jgi:hypothetical protein